MNLSIKSNNSMDLAGYLVLCLLHPAARDQRDAGGCGSKTCDLGCGCNHRNHALLPQVLTGPSLSLDPDLDPVPDPNGGGATCGSD